MRSFERKSEQVQIEGKVITIKEITPALALDYIEGKKSFGVESIKEILPAISDTTLDDLRNYTIQSIDRPL